jgi:hypothetical protein
LWARRAGRQPFEGNQRVRQLTPIRSSQMD